MDPAPTWRKSSLSGNQDCVEVASHLHAVRDSKQPSASLHVDVRRLLDKVRAGLFTR